MTVIKLVMTRDELLAVRERLQDDGAQTPTISELVPYRPDLAERVPLGQLELWTLLIDFGVGVAAHAAYDIVLHALSGAKAHKVEVVPDDDTPDDV